jgi:hypothetical protein
MDDAWESLQDTISEMDHDDKIATSVFVGIATVVLLAIGIGIHKGYNYYTSQKYKDICKTQELVKTVAEGLIVSDPKVMDAWSKGEYKDSWGHVLIICAHDPEKVFQVASRGPDGELGTADDIVSEMKTRAKRPVAAPVAKPEPKPASLKDKVEDAAVDIAKKTVNDKIESWKKKINE